MPLNRESDQSMQAIRVAHASLRQAARTLEEHDAKEWADWMTASADKLLAVIDPEAEKPEPAARPATPPRRTAPAVKPPPSLDPLPADRKTGPADAGPDSK